MKFCTIILTMYNSAFYHNFCYIFTANENVACHCALS